MTRGKPQQSRREGMTLVEVVVASAIMLIVFVALFSGLSFARRATQLTEHRLQALHLARQTLEGLRIKSYTAAELDKKSYGLALPAPFSGSYVVSEPVRDELKNIKVIIKWREKGWGPEQTLELETQMSQWLHL